MKLYDFIEDSEGRKVIIIEFLEGGELLSRIKTKEHYTEHNALQLMYSLILSVQILHDAGVLHWYRYNSFCNHIMDVSIATLSLKI